MSESVSLNVTGMKCGGCESAVTNKLLVVEGVVSVQASHQDNRVDIEYNEAEASLQTLKMIIWGSYENLTTSYYIIIIHY